MTDQQPEKPTHKNRANPEPKTVERPAEEQKIVKAFQQVAGTAAGVDVLRWIMDQCGYKLPSTVRQMNMSPDGKSIQVGDILPLSTTYNESKRDVWLTIRKMVRTDRLNLIEMEREPDA